jgi:hypothetical protein
MTSQEHQLSMHTHDTVVKGISDPLPKGGFGEEGVALT